MQHFVKSGEEKEAYRIPRKLDVELNLLVFAVRVENAKLKSANIIYAIRNDIMHEVALLAPPDAPASMRLYI